MSTHELTIICTVPTTGDAMDSAGLISSASDQIEALKAWAVEKGGKVDVKVIRKSGPRQEKVKAASNPVKAAQDLGNGHIGLASAAE